MIRTRKPDSSLDVNAKLFRNVDSCVCILKCALKPYISAWVKQRARLRSRSKISLAVRQFLIVIGKAFVAHVNERLVAKITIAITFWITFRNVFRNVILVHVNTPIDIPAQKQHAHTMKHLVAPLTKSATFFPSTQFNKTDVLIMKITLNCKECLLKLCVI